MVGYTEEREANLPAQEPIPRLRVPRRLDGFEAPSREHDDEVAMHCSREIIWQWDPLLGQSPQPYRRASWRVC
jgi:hypothetical protein